jgi:group I intron endonuclease
MFTNFNFLNIHNKVMDRSYRSLFFTKFYYYLIVFFNNKILLFLFIILCNISIYFVLNDNIVYCMGEDEDKIMSSDSTYSTKKRKVLPILEGRPSFDTTSNTSNIPDKEFIVRIPLSMGIQIDAHNMFKYIGVGAVLTGGGIGAAKILAKLPYNTRAGVVTTITGMGFMYQASISTMREVFESIRNKNSNISSNPITSSSSTTIPNLSIPISTEDPNQFEIDSTIKLDNYSINAIFKNNTLTLKDLKKDNILINNEDNNKELINQNTLSQETLEKDYYTITDSHNINSMLENGDLLSIAQNNPYFKLELLLFLGLCFLLYIILSLTIVTLINKYNYKIKEYFKNKYILMYINFNNKYINYIICFWFLALYLTTFLLMAISYTLIYGFETYCVQTPEIVNSLIFISWHKNKLFIKKNSPLYYFIDKNISNTTKSLNLFLVFFVRNFTNLNNFNNMSKKGYPSSKVYLNTDTDKLDIIKDNKGKAGIYLWTHISSGATYVGSSTDISKRLNSYYSLSYLTRRKKSYICNALALHGYSAFSFTILEYIELTDLSKDQIKNYILEREQYYINVLAPEYNILRIAGSSLGYKHKEEDKLYADKNPMFGRTGKLNPFYGKSHDQETLFKMSEAKKGSKHTAETLTKLSEANIGKKHLPDTLIKMSEAKKGENHPMFGKVALNAKKVYIYTLNNELYKECSSIMEAAVLLNTYTIKINKYIVSGEAFESKYIIRYSKI